MGSKTRVILVLGAIILAVALYLMPSKAPVKNLQKEQSSKTAENQPMGFNIESFIESTKQQYQPEQLAVITGLETAGNTTSPAVLDSLATAWDVLNQPGIAAYYFEQLAEQNQQEKSFLNAAYRYFDAFKESDDSVLHAAFVQKAIKNYQKVLELNPKNLDAKTDLGVCYTEGTAEPMKGIMMLREVIGENPNHENAQLNLGFLSVKSTQYEKAMERFSRVLEINPKRIDVYIYMGETSLSMGNKEKALEYFERFIKESPDEAMKKQVAEYIKEINK